MKFLKDSLRELSHVVWPTKEDSKKYFIIVISVLVLFGIYLAIFGNIFSVILLKTKEIVQPTNIQHITTENISNKINDISSGVIENEDNSTSSGIITTGTGV